MSRASMTAIVEALAPFAGGLGTPFPKPEDFRRAADAFKTAPVLAQYVKGLEKKAAALLEEVTYLSGKYPLEPSLSELEVAADDLRAALGGKP